MAAIGIPDEKWGERPLLLIVARDGVEEHQVRDGIVTAVRAAGSGDLRLRCQSGCFMQIAETSVGKTIKMASRRVL